MLDEFATDVGSLIAVLKKLDPKQKVIGDECRALLHVIEQDTGTVLIVQAHPRHSRSPLSAA